MIPALPWKGICDFISSQKHGDMKIRKKNATSSQQLTSTSLAFIFFAFTKFGFSI
jgi:hypothetical protein